MHSDLSQCYGSIYTHALQWAIYGKVASKAAASYARASLPGGALDEASRNAQDGQTKGVPIGPDTSLVLAELILTAIDAEFVTRMPLPGGRRVPALRNVDDFEYYASTRTEAEEALLHWELAAASYEMQINSAKTGIEEVPHPLDTGWRIALTQFAFGTRSKERRRNLVDFFSQAFELSRQHREDAVVSFAISHARRSGLATDSGTAPLLFDMLLPSMTAEPSCIHYALPVITLITRVARINKTKLAEALNSLAKYHSSREHGSEVGWALYGLILLGADLDLGTANAVSRMEDNAAVLELLLMERLGLVPAGGVLHTTIDPRVAAPGAILGSDWLLAYESTVQGWTPPATTAADPFLQGMARAGVTFLNAAKAPLGRFVAPAASRPWFALVPRFTAGYGGI